MYTKHQKLPQTSKHYKQSSLHSSVLVIAVVPFGVSASVASSLCGVLSFRGFILVGRECVRVGGGRKASLALGLTRLFVFVLIRQGREERGMSGEDQSAGAAARCRWGRRAGARQMIIIFPLTRCCLCSLLDLSINTLTNHWWGTIEMLKLFGRQFVGAVLALRARSLVPLLLRELKPAGANGIPQPVAIAAFLIIAHRSNGVPDTALFQNGWYCVGAVQSSSRQCSV